MILAGFRSQKVDIKGGITLHLVEVDTFTEASLSDVVSRDCVLWLTDTVFGDQNDLDAYVALVNGPWRGVYVETTSSEFAHSIAAQDSCQTTANSSASFTHIIASDPVSLVLQRRSKPVFFLNGRSDGLVTEAANLPPRANVRRRLNMTARLRDLEPRRVVVVGNAPLAAVEDLVDLWGVDFRSLLTLVTADDAELEKSCCLLERTINLAVVERIKQSPIHFACDLVGRLGEYSDTVDARLIVTIQLPGGNQVNADIGSAELVEQPLSDFCDVIRIKDTLPVSPEDLRKEEFQSFFTRGELSWRPYAAGLPWTPNSAPERELITKLQQQLAAPPGSVQVFTVVSEPGAGGTTRARSLAYAAARAGFPSLLVRQRSEVPTSLELTGFLFRAVNVITKHAELEGLEHTGEPVWLLVLDVQHTGGGPEQLDRLCSEIIRSGRKVALLIVTSIQAEPDVSAEIPKTELDVVGHNLDATEVDSLGQHLNIFLRNFGESKSSTEWLSFWQLHRPDFDTGIASFWIALEFWLAGFLELGESIQSWVLRQFKSISSGVEVQRALMEIASFSVERKGVPERLLSPLRSPNLPWSHVLDISRRESPGLGLVQAFTFPYGRVWAMAHDVLARYLLNGIWNDRLLCERLAIPMYEDVVALRLGMIAELSQRATMGEGFARDFAVALATTVLKLDEQHGNAEFFKHWRTVISILERVPQNIRLSSRAFNHHLAISRRRVTQGDLFQLDDRQKNGLLLAAARDVEFALEQISAVQDDESDLNLLNTLALIYQDLADLERGPNGNPQELARFLIKSEEITNRALKENPNSSYVLETAAKNLLRQSSSSESEQVESAAKALSFIFQASRLDTAYARRMKLGLLVVRALKVLRGEGAEHVIDHLCSQGSSYGYVARAWASLPINGDDDESSLLLDSITKEVAEQAIDCLQESPTRDWLLVRLQYDLVVIARERDFDAQLRLLDELASTRGYQLSLQQVLERAVLLYFAGSHNQARDEFKWLRPRAKEAQVAVFVPPRLRWLLTPDHAARAICTAQVVDAVGRGMAAVKELGGTWVPFNPQEFGKARMAANEHFKCHVTFAAMGPFLKPVDALQQ